MVLEIAVDGSLEIYDGIEHATAETASGKRREEGLDGVKPGARCWGEVAHPAGMAGESLDGLGRLVPGIVIEHDTNHLSGRDLAFYGVKETDEPLMPVALHASAEHGAVENVEDSEQRRCSMVFVVMGHGATFSGLER